MKTIATLATATAVVGLALSLVPSSATVGLFAVAISASFASLIAADYSPRRRNWEPRSLKLAAADHHLRLAA